MIDDVAGRALERGRNPQREALCAFLRLRDVTGDDATDSSSVKIDAPLADAVFCRGQLPEVARVGDVVENDVGTVLSLVRGERVRGNRGWRSAETREPTWSMILLDLCFLTGEVTRKSDRRCAGVPQGRLADEDPASYFGLVLLKAIEAAFPLLPILLLSSKPRDEVSLQFARLGAIGFVARDDLRAPELLEDALWRHGLLPDPDGSLVGCTPTFLACLRDARRAALHRENVLICGERGTGKELLARYIHRMTTARASGAEPAFAAVNSASFTPALFAAELFGVEARVATGVDEKVGIIERAHGGDVFLDEIADMPAEVQAGLLRVLQERQVIRVGGHAAKRVDVRFLAATNADLDEPASALRRDLLDRLRAGGSVRLPPLRERIDDIPVLVEAFVREAEAAHPGSLRRIVDPEATEQMMRHDWQGNVRELRSAIFEAVRRFPNVEHFVPGHLSLVDGQARVKAGDRDEHASRSIREGAECIRERPFDDVLRALSQAAEEDYPIEQWAGRLCEFQTLHHRAVARLLRAALQATRRRTPSNLSGSIRIHPAVKVLTGNESLTASQAADLVKRLLAPLEGELEGDLLHAYQTALRLRPRGNVTSRR